MKTIDGKQYEEYEEVFTEPGGTWNPHVLHNHLNNHLVVTWPQTAIIFHWLWAAYYMFSISIKDEATMFKLLKAVSIALARLLETVDENDRKIELLRVLEPLAPGGPLQTILPKWRHNLSEGGPENAQNIIPWLWGQLGAKITPEEGADCKVWYDPPLEAQLSEIERRHGIGKTM